MKKKSFLILSLLLSCRTAGWHCEVVKAPRAPRPTKACSPLLRCNYYAIYEVNCFAISLFNKILHPSNSPQSNLTACLRSQIGWWGMETGSCQIAGWEISGDKLAESFHTGIPINATSATIKAANQNTESWQNADMETITSSCVRKVRSRMHRNGSWMHIIAVVCPASNPIMATANTHRFKSWDASVFRMQFAISLVRCLHCILWEDSCQNTMTLSLLCGGNVDNSLKKQLAVAMTMTMTIAMTIAQQRWQHVLLSRVKSVNHSILGLHY